MTWFRAPGRVNLMGDHTDYNDGLVLPIAIQFDCVVGCAPNGEGAVRVLNLDAPSAEQFVEMKSDGSDDPRSIDLQWSRYVAALLVTLRDLGRPAVGLDLAIASSIPIASGLSSSAALEVACALGLCRGSGFRPKPDVLILACRDAEELASGVPCGIMDQTVSLRARRGQALLVDCRDRSTRHVTVSPEIGFIVVHTGIHRQLAGSEYVHRRRACELVARELGLSSLRSASPKQVADNPLGRHVISENLRVVDAAEALADGDAAELGRLFDHSHASLRDDFIVSCSELDLAASALKVAGAKGARMFGAGFGGCVVGVVHRMRAAALLDAALRSVESELPGAFGFVAEPSAGARRLKITPV